MLPAPNRLRARSDFTSVLRSRGGIRVGSHLFVLHIHQADARAGLPPRVGFVVSKQVGGAVVRNKVKRRLRALASAQLSQLPAGADVVIRANPSTAHATFDELRKGLNPLLEKAIRRLAVPV